MILGISDFVMEEANGGKIGFDCAGRLALLLHPDDVGSQVFAADVCQFLQVIRLCKEPAEALHGFIVAGLGAKTSLSVVSDQLVQLFDQWEISPLYGRCYLDTPFF